MQCVYIVDAEPYWNMQCVYMWFNLYNLLCRTLRSQPPKATLGPETWPVKGWSGLRPGAAQKSVAVVCCCAVVCPNFEASTCTISL